MEFSRTAIRTLSMLGQRGSFGTALADLALENSDVIALSADLCNTSGLDRFKMLYPERFINVGIAEQNMVGICAGLASGGNIPFATTFSNFFSLRSCEQIRHFLGYMKENVKLVGLGSGFAMGMFGITHYGIEDIASIRSISDIIILSPADSLEVYKCTFAAAEIDAPVYIRLSGVMNNPIVYKENYDFKIGKAITLREGKDIAVIATGSMVSTALKVAKSLEDKGVDAKVINMHTIKPLDLEAVKECCGTKLIVTIEEHSVIGGLGSSVSEVLTKLSNKPKQLIIGVENEYKRAGTYEFMLEQYGLTPEFIENKILNEIQGEIKNDKS